MDEPNIIGLGRGAGRGGGVSVLDALGLRFGSSSSSDLIVRRSAPVSIDRPGYHQEDISESRHRDSSRDRDMSRRDTDSRHVDRDRNRDRHRDQVYRSDYRSDRSRYDSRDRDRHQDGDRDHYRDRDRDQARYRDSSRDRHHRDRDRDRDRGHDSSRDNTNDSSHNSIKNKDQYMGENSDRKHDTNFSKQKTITTTSSSYRKSEPDTGESATKHTSEDNRENNEDVNENEVNLDEASDTIPSFTFTAPQIINRFIEVFSDTKLSSENRLNSLIDLFHPNISIASLKSEKLLLDGSDAVRQSFARTQACYAETARRIYVPCPTQASDESLLVTDNNINSTSTETFVSNYSYVLDFHAPGATPGLGDRTKDTVLLYECEESTIKITRVWGAVDTDKLASKDTVTKLEVCRSQAWKLALAIISKRYPSFDHTCDLHFHDYVNIETI